jgi:hypothetical protein
MSRPASHREGFVLVAVLWLIVGVATVAAAANIVGRNSQYGARNRIAITRARWLAEGCAERARAAVAEALLVKRSPSASEASTWAMLDTIVGVAPLVQAEPDCEVRLVAVGRALDANAASEDQLVALFEAAGIAHALEAAQSVVDWRDRDGESRPAGAEGDWYATAGRVAPHNDAISDGSEFSLIRGLESVPDIESLLSHEPARICLGHAHAAVFVSLPGFTPEAIDRLMGLRSHGVAPPTILTLVGMLSGPARDSLQAHSLELSMVTTREPDAWLLLSTARAGVPEVHVTVEIKLANAGTRAAIVRRRITG